MARTAPGASTNAPAYNSTHDEMRALSWLVVAACLPPPQVDRIERAPIFQSSWHSIGIGIFNHVTTRVHPSIHCSVKTNSQVLSDRPLARRSLIHYSKIFFLYFANSRQSYGAWKNAHGLSPWNNRKLPAALKLRVDRCGKLEILNSPRSAYHKRVVRDNLFLRFATFLLEASSGRLWHRPETGR